MSDRVEKTIDLRAPVERVWHALTDHEEFGKWFRVAVGDPFVVGQVVRGRITYPGYEHLTWEAKILHMQAPHLFSFSWHPYAVDPTVDYSQETPTVVEFRLTPIATGTRLVVVESGFDTLPSHRRPDALRMNDTGWAEQLRNIKAHVEP